MVKSTPTNLASWTLGFCLGCAIASLGWWTTQWQGAIASAQEKKQSDVSKQVAKESPPYRGLDANLFMQTSAEYRACCWQAYQWADRIVIDRLKTREASTKAPAVVFDLDETVLDNGRFQTKQIRDGNAFDAGLWTQWEQSGSDELDVVPGALRFIHQLESLGVQRFYITNRNESCRKQTMAALNRLGIAVPDDQLLLASDATGSNKTSRRQIAEEKFDVLLYVGDNLRDFDEVFRYADAQGIEGRKRAVDERSSKFGTDWILLPNPAYGEWLKPLGKGETDANQLVPKL